MKWDDGGRSEDLEDRRGESDGGGGGGGGFGGMRLGLGGFVILFILSIVFKRNFFGLVGGGGGAPVPRPAPRASGSGSAGNAGDEKRVRFVSFVLDDAQKTWTQLLPGYRRAKLVLFTDSIRSGCGRAESSTGPFYCPADQKVYIDLGFYEELSRRFGAPGEFAQAYVIAHELGHHVQNLTGIERQVRQQQEARPDQENALSVRMELQADCFAGVWGHSTNERGILEKGDVESALNAAAAIGDDRLQKMARGHVSPETFTHGSSAQRVYWFKKGLETGSPNACDTFKVRTP